MNNKYNLDEQFSGLSTKRISNMINSRIQKESNLSEEINEIETKQEKCFSDDYYDSLQLKIEKLRTNQEDILDWMAAAQHLFSEALWMELVDHNQTFIAG